METYARHLVVQCWPRTPDEDNPPLRPLASFHTLRDAVADADRRADAERIGLVSFQVWDLEHLHLGDMLQAPDCAALIARFRQEAA